MIKSGEKFLNQYVIEKRIFENTISGVTVWKAVDENFESDVAIKEIKIDKGKEKEAREAAKEEGKLMRRLSRSPHILTVWGMHSDDASVYLVMDYAGGDSLRARLEKEDGKLSEKDAKRICIEICKGVAYAHDRDVMHRDLKPENILFVEGVAQIGDFGIARVLEGTRKASTAGVGTSHYIAPEQFDDEYDKRVDIWAIGIILYEMLVGEPPFVGKTPAQIMKKVYFDEPEIPEFIDEPFRTVIQKALRKASDDRYQTADEIVEALTTPERVYVPPRTETKTEYRDEEELPKEITGNDGAPMLLIPAGEFEMGSDDGRDNEKPVHTVYTDAFYMDKYQVTNELYAKFLNEYGKSEDDDGNELLDIDSEYCLIEKSGSSYRPKSGFEDHPVVEVSWYGAKAYAEFYGKRLPTEAEWEKAARGGLVGKRYPWGDESPDSSKANYGGNEGGTTPVGKYPPNGYGLYDMAGNVWEWCADCYDKNYYSNSPRGNPLGPASGVRRVCRGSSWLYNDYGLRVSYRSLYSLYVLEHYAYGFRCCGFAG